MSQPEPCYERNPDFVFRKVVEEFILVPIRQDVADMNCIYSLNSVGAYIWEQLAQYATPSQLQSALLAEFDAEPDILAADLEGFLQEMTAIGALRKV